MTARIFAKIVGWSVPTWRLVTWWIEHPRRFRVFLQCSRQYLIHFEEDDDVAYASISSNQSEQRMDSVARSREVELLVLLQRVLGLINCGKLKCFFCWVNIIPKAKESARTNSYTHSPRFIILGNGSRKPLRLYHTVQQIARISNAMRWWTHLFM